MVDIHIAQYQRRGIFRSEKHNYTISSDQNVGHEVQLGSDVILDKVQILAG